MKVAIVSDHGGYKLKEAIKEYMEVRGIEVIDLGTDSEESVDYPVYGKKCAEYVVKGEADRGVVCCGMGIGISIAANKVKGIRCALCTNVFMAEMSRKHNNANMIAFGGRVLSEKEGVKLTQVWLDTEFEGGRHKMRTDLLDEM